MSSATFYKWRAKFGGMDASMMTRLKELEEENRRLKTMYAEERLKAEYRASTILAGRIASLRNNTLPCWYKPGPKIISFALTQSA